MKTIAIILALIVLSLTIAGCGMQETAPADSTVDDISADVDDLTAALDADLTELDALDQELAELEAMDLG